jgi:hypothetical protein
MMRILAAALGVVVALAIAAEVEARPRAAVVKRDSKVRKKPKKRAAVTFRVAPGDRVVVLGTRSRWAEPVTFPITVFTSACPDVVPMPIISSLGDCNSCHVAGDRITFSP